ncbi:hypothetical protein Tco_1025303 [Tanacetum coccineum]
MSKVTAVSEVVAKETKEKMWKLRKKPQRRPKSTAWTQSPMSCFWRNGLFKFSRIQKPGFNNLYEKRSPTAHSGENDETYGDGAPIVLVNHRRGGLSTGVLGIFDRHKWKNPESTLQRRSRLRGIDKEPDHFGDDGLPRLPGLQRIAKSQRTGSNSTASSGSNPSLSRVHGGTIRLRNWVSNRPGRVTGLPVQPPGQPDLPQQKK